MWLPRRSLVTPERAQHISFTFGGQGLVFQPAEETLNGKTPHDTGIALRESSRKESKSRGLIKSAPAEHWKEDKLRSKEIPDSIKRLSMKADVRRKTNYSGESRYANGNSILEQD
ncbi:UNVERIFIED_CONTAM: hypothetical protein K2H54_054175 [Gekko kuhli]